MAVSAVSLALNRLSQCPIFVSIACSFVVVIVFGVKLAVSNLFEGVSQT